MEEVINVVRMGVTDACGAKPSRKLSYGRMLLPSGDGLIVELVRLDVQ
jgi:hypothetical protein